MKIRPGNKRLLASLSLVVILLALNFIKLEGSTTNQSNSDDTKRIDPLDGFKKYRGGYDIRNKHYWSSTIFTGIYGYAISVVWLLCGLIYGGYLLAITFCCKTRSRKIKKRSPPFEQKIHLWHSLLGIIFTVLAITVTGVVLGGNSSFHSRADKVVDIIIDTADEASNTIYNTTGAMREMSRRLSSVNESGADASGFLTRTSRQLDAQAADIERQARKNRRAIEKGLKIVYIVTVVIFSLNLTATIAITVFGILVFRRSLHTLIVLCWILTFFCWLFFGLYFFIAKFAGDTCTAFENFQDDPYNSSLSSILPCDELLSAKSTLSDVGAGVYDLVNEVNRNLLRNYGNIAQVCNPFSAPPEYQYQPNNCSADTIRIGQIPRLLRVLTCTDGTCTGGILISASEFNMAEAYSTSIQRLLDVYPGMTSLVECQTVKDAFSEIVERQCEPLKKYVRMVWIPLVFLSVIMMALVLSWLIETRRKQDHRSFGGSVKPVSRSTDTIESGESRTDLQPNSSTQTN